VIWVRLRYRMEWAMILRNLELWHAHGRCQCRRGCIGCHGQWHSMYGTFQIKVGGCMQNYVITKV
jgi:hypothetical protein